MKLSYQRPRSTIYNSVLLLLIVISVELWTRFSTVQAGTSNHRYKKDEHVELWVNKVRVVYERPPTLRESVLAFRLGLGFLCNERHSHPYVLYLPCCFLFVGWSVCQSTRSVRILHTALLCTGYEAPSRRHGYDESLQCVRLPINRRTLIGTLLTTFGTRYYIRLYRQNGKLYDETHHRIRGGTIPYRHSTSMVLSNVLG
jgi:hypothetical protein